MRESTSILIGPRELPGDLFAVRGSAGLVIFVHGSDSSRRSRRNIQVAQTLQRHQLSTLLFDLLTREETQDRANVFDIELLASRVHEAIEALPATLGAPRIGLFGSSTGAAAALVAAAHRPERVQAIVCRGGRPELAGPALRDVRAPTLLIVGAADPEVMRLNREASNQLQCEKRFEVISRATHLFQEAGALDAVARLGSEWFEAWLRPLGEVTAN